MLLGKLASFKEKVARKQVDWWTNADQLSGQVLACLATQIPLASRPGWVRGSTLSGSAVADEISRLSRENAELRDHLQQPRTPVLAIRLIDATLSVRDPNNSKDFSCYAVFVINPLNDRPTAIPLDSISFSLSSGECSLSIDILTCSGSEKDGKFGNRTHLEVTGPRRASLQSDTIGCSEQVMQSLTLVGTWIFKQLGFGGSYLIRSEMTFKEVGGEPRWHLTTPVEATFVNSTVG